MRNALVDVPGILVGHWDSPEEGTGCTVILTPQGATASVDVRGSAPGTRETDLLDPVMRVDQVHAIVLSGGSAFGLASADGAVRWLHERGYGWYTPVTRVPIVPAAILFDLGVGGSTRWPTGAEGYAACEAATDQDASRGSVGAGMGCSVGKLLGFERACRGGLGQASVTLPGGVVVAALIAVNAVGDIVDPSRATIIAGARDLETQTLVDALSQIQAAFDQYSFRRAPSSEQAEEQGSRENTTIGVVATNVRLSKSDAKKLAQMAHDGLARTMRPAHTSYDGDALFALSTATIDQPVDLSILGAIAAEVTAAAVLDGVRNATPAYGLPTAGELIPRMIGG
jgi:L-aminopeptidase/D-esterase-like protein